MQERSVTSSETQALSHQRLISAGTRVAASSIIGVCINTRTEKIRNALSRVRLCKNVEVGSSSAQGQAGCVCVCVRVWRLGPPWLVSWILLDPSALHPRHIPAHRMLVGKTRLRCATRR